MNERIKELAKQAGLEFDDDLALEPEPIYYTSQKDLEKFAELIVRECAEQVKNLHANKRISGAEIIREHFGVEE